MTAESLPPDEKQFWEEYVSLLLQTVCTIERYKLNRPYTTAQLRKMGKQAAATHGQSGTNSGDCDTGESGLAFS